MEVPNEAVDEIIISEHSPVENTELEQDAENHQNNEISASNNAEPEEKPQENDTVDEVDHDQEDTIATKQVEVQDPLKSSIISETSVKYLGKTVTQRVRIMNAMAGYFEDYVDNELAIQKSLTKLGSQYSTVKIEWFQGYLSVVDEFAFKTMISNKSKYHQQLSGQITNNLTKILREIFKVYPQNVQQKINYLTSLLDDLKRARNAHIKNIDKYTKLIRDTEGQIRARDNLVLSNAAHSAAANDNANQNGKDDDTMSTTSTSSTVTTSSTASAAKEERMLGRSFKSMLSKINNPSASAGNLSAAQQNERRLEDRCKELFKEIDIAEKSLASNTESLNTYRKELVNTARHTLDELLEIEFGRLSALKDALLNFLSAYGEAYLSHLLTSVADLSTKFSCFLTESEEAQLTGAICPPVTSSPIFEFIHPMVHFMTSTPEISENFQADKSEVSALFLRIGRLTDTLTSFVDLVTRLSAHFSEAIDIDRTYWKTIQNNFEKHGFQRSPSMDNIFPAAGSNKFLVTNSITNPSTTNNAGHLLSTLELPTMKKAAEAFVVGLGRINELLAKSLESTADEVSESLLALKDRLFVLKKDLIDKSFTSIKRLEASFSNLSKVRAELKKLKALLKERRQTVRQAKDEVEVVDGKDKDKEASLRDSENETLQKNASLTGMEPPTTEAAAPAAVEEDEFPLTPANPSGVTGTGRKQSLLSSVKFKQAVGFESATDRISRIEHQITGLEDKEVELTQRQDQLSKALLDDIATAKTELQTLLQTNSTAFLAVVHEFKSVMDLSSKLQLQKFQGSRETVKGVRDFMQQRLRPQEDIDHLRRLFVQQEVPAADLFEIPLVEQFRPVASAFLAEGRQRVMQRLPPPVQPALLAVMQQAQQQKDGASPPPPPIAAPSSPEHDVAANKTALPPSPEKALSLQSGTALAIIPEEGPLDDAANSPQVLVAGSESVLEEQATNRTRGDSSSELEGAVALKRSDSSVSRAGQQGGVSADWELKKFGLSIQDKVLESFSCALYPKKAILTHGRMYITQHYVAFSGWPDTRVLLSMRRIENIVKANTLMYIPNAITIVMSDKSEYFFASFIDRDLCYQLLTNMTQVEKRICELAGPDSVAEPPHLVFGYQHRATIISANRSGHDDELGPGDDADSGDGDGGRAMGDDSEAEDIEHADRENEEADQPEASTSSNSNHVNSSSSRAPPSVSVPATALGAADSPSQAQSVKVASQKVSNDSTPIAAQAAVSAPSESAKSVAPAAPVVPPPPPKKKNHTPFPKAATLYKDYNITTLTKKTLQGTAAEAWEFFWKAGTSYKQFLTSAGDVSKSFNEWRKYTSSPEDVTKTKFHFERDMEYDHARTTMLMFGPKMAPTKLKQFIYLHNDYDEEVTLEEVHPRGFIVLAVSFCEGVPMADVFKVLQYWVFSTNDDGETCDVTIGMALHYIKSSMFKGQIFQGAKDEMVGQLETWATYINQLLVKKKKEKAKKAAAAAALAAGEPVAATSAATSAKTETLEKDETVEEEEEEIVITTTDEQNHRHSRRLSIGKSVTISTPASSTIIAEQAPDTLFYGLSLHSWVLVALVFVLFLQFLMLWRLSSEVSGLKALLRSKFPEL